MYTRILPSSLKCPICNKPLRGTSTVNNLQCSAHDFPHYKVEYTDDTFTEKISERLLGHHGHMWIKYVSKESLLMKIPGSIPGDAATFKQNFTVPQSWAIVNNPTMIDELLAMSRS